MVDLLGVVKVITVLLLVLGLVLIVVGLSTTAQRWPWAMAYGVTMLVLGFAMLVGLLVAASAGVGL
jgi:hypothetical protein